MCLMSPRGNKGYCIPKNSGKVIKSELWGNANNILVGLGKFLTFLQKWEMIRRF